nr:MAG TPA: hypothetical protein [Bacteriophage sp.]
MELFVITSLGSFTTCVLSAIAYVFLPWKLTVLVVPCIENLDNPLKHLPHLTTILPYTLNKLSHLSKVLVIYAGLFTSIENCISLIPLLDCILNSCILENSDKSRS